jgi:hypothetical protein
LAARHASAFVTNSDDSQYEIPAIGRTIVLRMAFCLL